MAKAIGYIRCSSQEQADSGLGLEAQRERIKAYCTMKGLELVEVFEDAGVSGGKPLSTRPAGSRVLAEARKSQAVLIVAKLDRLFRSVADAANTIAALEKKGIQIVSVAEGFDMTSIYGRAMAQMASVFAELERNMIRERTKAAMDQKKAKGERAGNVPYGKTLDADGKTLLPCQVEAATLQTIEHLRFTLSWSLRQIASELNRRGVKTRSGKPWGHSTIQSIVERAA